MCARGFYHSVYAGYRARHRHKEFFFICQLGKYLEFSVAADLSPPGKGGSEGLKWCVKSEIFSWSPSVPAGLWGSSRRAGMAQPALGFPSSFKCTLISALKL